MSDNNDIPQANKLFLQAGASIKKLENSSPQNKLLSEALSDMLMYLHQEFRDIKKSK